MLKDKLYPLLFIATPAAIAWRYGINICIPFAGGMSASLLVGMFDSTLISLVALTAATAAVFKYYDPTTTMLFGAGIAAEIMISLMVDNIPGFVRGQEEEG
jgi:hypothetical protein